MQGATNPDKTGIWPHRCLPIATIGTVKPSTGASRQRARRPFPMKRLLFSAWLTAVALGFPQAALAQHSEYDPLVAAQASANGVPEGLVHRGILPASPYRTHRVRRGHV